MDPSTIDKRKARGGNLQQQQAELEQIRARLAEMREEIHKLAYKENKLYDKIIKRQRYATDPEYRKHAIAQVLESQRKKREKQKLEKATADTSESTEL